MKKVLVLGSTGMLGHVLYNYLDSYSKYILFNVSFRKKLNSKTRIIDVTNFDNLKEYILEIKPDFIVNCIGVLINGSKQNIKNAIYLNAYLPHLLNQLSNSMNSKLIHISTDCVFSGKTGVYDEYSIKDAIDEYGKTKSLGEFDSEPGLCIRTSIIGPEIKQNGEGLLHWLFQQKGKVFGYTNVYWSGVTTLELSKAIKFSIENNVDGLWNLTNCEPISKYDLLYKIIKIFSLNNIELDKNFEKKSNKTLKSTRDINYKVSNYDSMIKEMFDNFENNRVLYSYNI